MELQEKQKYFFQLDGFRAIAVLAVMVAHYIKPLSIGVIFNRLPWGNGVALFFVISGFLITRILLDMKESAALPNGNRWYSIKSFYMRRGLRIFPIYYITLLVLYIINNPETLEYFPWLMTYTINIKMSLENSYIGPVTHFWSLAVEEQFYLGWAFIIMLTPKKYILKLIIVTILISLSYKFYLHYYSSMWMGVNALTMSNMDQLGFGALLAYLYNYHKEFVVRIAKMNLLLIFLTAIFIFIFIFPKFEIFGMIQTVYKPAFVGLLSFFLLAKASLGTYTGWFAWLLQSKFFLYTGRISYGLYIYHNLVGIFFYNFLAKHLDIGSIPNYQRIIIYVILAYAIASLSWFLIEKPINGLKKYFPYQKKQPSLISE